LTVRENDETAARLLEKYGPEVELDLPDFIEGEQTLYGKIMLPDVTGGMGPLYTAQFRKRKAG
jgi:16S rRNA (cytosine1407-C5)-methyltransferase